jgi:hypothetical protein
MAPPRENRFRNIPRETFRGNPSRALQIERDQTRDQFFKGDDRISNQRLDKRRIQRDLENEFKRKNLKGVSGATGLFQKKDPLGQDLSEFRRQTAMKYGPTLSEIGGDIRAGLGGIFQDLAEKGSPIIQLFQGVGEKFKGGVERLWDRVRGESPQQVGTAFPQPGLDTKDLFSSINTGIANDPNNLLVQIAMANQDRFGDTPTFEEQLANATAQNFNFPSITDIVETTTDAISKAQEGVTVDTPFGKVNVNPLNQNLSFGNQEGSNIQYGGGVTSEGDFNVGVGAALPGNFKLNVGAQSGDIPGASLSNRLLSTIRGVDDFVPSLRVSSEGDLNLGLNTQIDPLKMMGINSAIPFDIGVGANINDRGQFTPNINFNLPFNSNQGLGFMLK